MKKIIKNLKKFLGGNKKGSLNTQSKDPIENEKHIEDLIDKIVHNPDEIFNITNDDINLLVSCLHPSCYKGKVLPLWAEGKISCFFKIPENNKNYIITEIFDKYKKRFSEIKVPSTILSIQDLEIPHNKKFKQSYSNKALDLLGKQNSKNDPLGLFVTSRLPKTKLKIKLKHKNKISEVIIKIGSWNDKILQWQNDFKKANFLTTKQAILARKEFSWEFFFSGQISNLKVNQIRNNEITEYKPKTLIQNFLELDSEYPVHEWAEHLTTRIEQLVKPEIRKNNKGIFSTFKKSFLSFNYELPKSGKYKDIKTLKIFDYVEDEFFIGGHSPSNGDVMIEVSRTDVTNKSKEKKKKLKSQDDLTSFLVNTSPGTNLDITFKRKDGTKAISVIKTKNFDEFCRSLVKDWGKEIGNYSQAEIAVKAARQSYLIGYPDFSDKIFEDIKKSPLEDLAKSKYVNEDEIDNETNYNSIDFTLSKEKISGQMSFLLKFDEWPSIENFLSNETKLFLNVFIYDVTDLDADEITRRQEEYLDIDSYFIKDSHILKTNSPGWSVGNDNLVQSKEILSQLDLPDELAFPFNVITFPKGGKRKLNFRVFITNEKIKYDELSGRPIINGLINCRPDEFEFMNDYEFDPYSDYEDIKVYGTKTIEAEYKLPGYLEKNRKETSYLKSIIATNLVLLREKNLKNAFKVIKDEFMYDNNGYDYNERPIFQTLNLVKAYNCLKENNLKLKINFKEIRNKTLINEKYNIIDTLLNLSTRDDKFYANEDDFLNNVASQLELDNKKYLEIKKQKTINAKMVNFSNKNEEEMFGINKQMSKDEKIKTLRSEYSRWNALTNHSDKTKREKARNMRDLAAKLRSQIN